MGAYLTLCVHYISFPQCHTRGYAETENLNTRQVSALVFVALTIVATDTVVTNTRSLISRLVRVLSGSRHRISARRTYPEFVTHHTCSHTRGIDRSELAKRLMFHRLKLYRRATHSSVELHLKQVWCS